MDQDRCPLGPSDHPIIQRPKVKRNTKRTLNYSIPRSYQRRRGTSPASYPNPTKRPRRRTTRTTRRKQPTRGHPPSSHQTNSTIPPISTPTSPSTPSSSSPSLPSSPQCPLGKNHIPLPSPRAPLQDPHPRQRLLRRSPPSAPPHRLRFAACGESYAEAWRQSCKGTRAGAGVAGVAGADWDDCGFVGGGEGVCCDKLGWGSGGLVGCGSFVPFIFDFNFN